MMSASELPDPNLNKTMCLFKEFERTHDGPSDPGESLYDYIDRSDRPQAKEARDLCNQWFADYAKVVSKDERSRFQGDFRSKDNRQHYAAWFELLTHQLLVKLGFSVTMHPLLPGNDKRSDFEASSNGYRVLVEATVVAPDNDPLAPSDYEKDAQEKFSQIEIANFTTRIAQATGTLKRRLKMREIKREFERLVTEYDPDEVQRRRDQYGYGHVPTETIRFGDWQLQVELLPLPPDKRAPRKARIASWPQVVMYNSSVPNAKQKIKAKLKSYGPTNDPLILAVNVHNLGGFTSRIDGHEVLFGKDGIWNVNRSGPAAVLFISNTNSYAVSSTKACLFVNPTLNPYDLPATLLRVPYIHGPDGSKCRDGESVPNVLGLS